MLETEPGFAQLNLDSGKREFKDLDWHRFARASGQTRYFNLWVCISKVKNAAL